jgi:hypothetical protein
VTCAGLPAAQTVPKGKGPYFADRTLQVETSVFETSAFETRVSVGTGGTLCLQEEGGIGVMSA